ncbi:MAG: hypothetical protein RBU27_06120 [Bacteroidota bacterium]|jgi:hypothetical protein|nr:hypothetical protein [Bacteroidota bacterium]
MPRALALPRVVVFLFMVPFFPGWSFGQTAVFDPFPTFDRGSVSLRVSMRGQMGVAPQSTGHGMFWPGNGISDPKTRGLMFSSTPVLVGRVRDTLRVSASFYRDTFVPGPILGGKPVVDPTDPFFRAYRISWMNEGEVDYAEWPASMGAPVDDGNVPYFYGASQMFWVMNDLDPVAAHAHNGCAPMGLEMRCLLYAPWPGDARDQTLMLQVTYINKGQDSIRDAYAGYFADADLRDGLNDLPGSDSTRAMVYVYQGSVLPREEGMPAAFGIAMPQTPAVTAPGDSARWFSGWKSGMRNIPVTAAVAPFKQQTTPLSEPVLGRDDTRQWLALMQGKGRETDALNPRTGEPSRFWYSGDPVTRDGWLPADGIRVSDGASFAQDAADQKLLISAGPFDLAPGDTQQVTYAFIATRGATPEAAVRDLRDRADFLHADFRGEPTATAYRGAFVRVPSRESAPADIEVVARMAGVPVDLRAEVRDNNGTVLADTQLDRYTSEDAWVYRKTVALAPRQDGVNVSFVAEWNGRTVRIPGRVSVPLGGSIDLDGIALLEEGDGNGRVAPEDDAKWFPRFVSNADFPYDILAQSHFLPPGQDLRIPGFSPRSVFPSAERAWSPEHGYATLYADSLAFGRDSVLVRYDVYDAGRNVWWERNHWVAVDSTAGEWYDVLMTQIRGSSDERPGVRLLDLAALQDKWYVASIGGGALDRQLTLHDSASGIPYFTGYGLDVFRGPAPVVDGFRVVRGTITQEGKGENPVSDADLFIFNPRHVLLARSRKSTGNAMVSRPVPMPLTEWTSLVIDLPEAGALRAEVYTLIGRRVAVLRDETLPAGRHLLVWDGHWSDGRMAETGTYLLRVVARGSEVTRKIMVVR